MEIQKADSKIRLLIRYVKPIRLKSSPNYFIKTILCMEL